MANKKITLPAPPQKATPAPKLSERKEAIAKTGSLSKDAPLPTLDTQEHAEAPPTEADNAAPKTGSAKNVVDRSKHTYEAHKDVKTAGGRASVDNDDPMAKALRGKDADAVVELVEENGGEVNPNWSFLNPGLRRMSAGNVLRKLARRSEGVKIDGNVLKLDPLPEDPARAAAKAEKEAEKAARAKVKQEAKDAAARAEAAKAAPAPEQKAA